MKIEKKRQKDHACMYKQTNVDKRINIYIYIYVKMNDKQQE